MLPRDKHHPVGTVQLSRNGRTVPILDLGTLVIESKTIGVFCFAITLYRQLLLNLLSTKTSGGSSHELLGSQLICCVPCHLVSPEELIYVCLYPI